MDKYKLIKDHLRETLAVGQALGLDIRRKGWYCTHQKMEMDPNLSPSDNSYVGPLCLIGVVGFVEGVGDPAYNKRGDGLARSHPRRDKVAGDWLLRLAKCARLHQGSARAARDRQGAGGGILLVKAAEVAEAV